MKFSILVPVYNVEKYLEQCVESLLNQTFKGEYEIILVDDGSTDSSGKICDRYQKSNPEKVKVIHKTNGGHTSAREAAVKASVGEFAFFCDSDDFVESNLLQSVASVLEKYPDADTVVYSFSYYKNGVKTPRKQTPAKQETLYSGETKKEIYEMLISTPLLSALWTKAFKSDILKNDSTDKSLYYDKKMGEDWFENIYYLTEAQKIVYINEPLYNYRTNEVSISRSFCPETIAGKNTLYVYDRFMDYLPKWNMNTAEYRQKLNARWLNETVYTFSTYYENVPAGDRKAVLNFDWSSMLPQEAKSDTGNPFENKSSRKLYNLIVNKKFLQLKLHFAYSRLYKKYRKLKARLMGK